MAINLAQVVASWIERRGDSDTIEFLAEKLGKTYNDTTIRNWRLMNNTPPLPVVQCIWDDLGIEIGTGAAGATLEEQTEPFGGAKIVIGSPVYREVSPWTYKATHVLRHKYQQQLGIYLEVGTDIAIQRNKIADRFLKSDAEWLLWLDDDMAPPIGYPSESAKWGAKFDPKFNEHDVIQRLMSHGKTFVGAVCFDRAGQGLPMFAEGRNNVEVAREMRVGPKDELRKTAWVGAGCTLTHRSVYEDMLEKMPDVRAQHDNVWNGFFTVMGNGYTEDASFAIRAAEIGHQPYVDLGCYCGHAGVMVHFNEKLR